MKTNDPGHAAVRSKVTDACCPTDKPSSPDDGMMGWPMPMSMDEDSGTDLDKPTMDEQHAQKWYESPRRGGDAT